jgi:3-hydroxyisobutyrate dehydrogenase
MKRVAFIGLGNMGRPMAENLLKKGFSLVVYDVNAEAVKSFAGASGATSVAEAVSGVDAVVTMLPSSPHVEDVYLGRGKLLEAARAGTLLMDCSTIAPDTARKVAAAAKAKNCEMIDAPVSGGTAGAQGATLTFMVGGSDSTLEKARPFLEAMGKNIFHAGDSGAGQVAKACNNMLLAIHMIGTAEALALGERCGMDPKRLSEIMSKSSGGNWSLEKYNPWPGVMENVPSSRGYQGGFAVDLMTKDLGLALEAALASGATTPLGSLARSLYRSHGEHGAGKLDFSSILSFFRRGA